MKTVLITGANRGIGWQAAKELSQKGFHVFLGTRDSKANGKKVADWDTNASWLTIDVSQSESIHKAFKSLTQKQNKLDILINNAGIYEDKSVSILDVSRESFAKTLQTNTFGSIEVIQIFLPLLRQSDSARIINVSSRLGQLASLSTNAPGYSLSKLALNGATLILAKQLEQDDIAVNSVSPGWVRTDMGGSNATRSIEEGTAGIVWLASEAPQSLTGKFLHDGKEIEW